MPASELTPSLTQPQSVDSSCFRLRSTCRGCSGRGLQTFLELGSQPLANSFLTEDHAPSEPYFPLEVVFCPNCALVQLSLDVDPEILFRDYIYVSGTSETVAVHYREYAREVVRLLDLGSDSIVLEAASNDGSLLRQFGELGVQTLGVEPATNLAEVAERAGVETINEFFSSKLAREIRRDRGPVQAIVANNVVAHVPDPCDFFVGCHELLDERGLFVFEVPYLRELVHDGQYDTIYHEHLCYFSAVSLKTICDIAGLSVVRVDRVPLHGGSLRVYAGRRQRLGSHASAFQQLVQEEEAMGMSELGFYQRFAAEIRMRRQLLVDLLTSLKDRGAALAGYGAPAKGNTLLNYCGIGRDLLPYCVDKNPRKVGKYTPGMHIPVLPVDAIRDRKPDHLLILAWNFADEIMRQQHHFRERGGRFIVPIPKARVC